MATLQNCDGMLNNLSRNADRPAVFTLRKRGSETWSYADLDGCVDRLARGLRHAGLARGDAAAIIADKGPEDHATLCYTSGTTAPPKGVPLTHSNLSVQIDAALATGLTSENDHLLLPLPLHHVYPFVIGMLAPLTRDLTVVIPQSLTGPQIIRALQEGEINVVVGVPRLYRALRSEE